MHKYSFLTTSITRSQTKKISVLWVTRTTEFSAGHNNSEHPDENQVEKFHSQIGTNRQSNPGFPRLAATVLTAGPLRSTFRSP